MSSSYVTSALRWSRSFRKTRANIGRLRQMRQVASPMVRCLVTGSNGSGSSDHEERNRQNFDRRVLQPASRGELTKKHESGIPRLAARKSKAHLQPVTRRRLVEEEESLAADDYYFNNETEGIGRPRMFEAISQGRMMQDGDDDDQVDIDLYMETFAQVLENDDSYYWKEADYEGNDDVGTNEEAQAAELEAVSAEFLAQGKGDDVSTEVEEVNDDDEKEDDAVADEILELEKKSKGGKEKRVQKTESDHMLAKFLKNNDILEWADDTSLVEKFETELPEPEEELIDQHVAENPHPDSSREPKPYFPKYRRQPDAHFLERYSRFLYVSGLPEFGVNGERPDLDNPVDRTLLQKTLAHLVDVAMDQVYPATASSGYVGLESPMELAETLAMGLTEEYVSSPPSFQPFREQEHDFAKVVPKATLLLDNIRRGSTSVSLARELFPANTEVGDAYGNITAADIFFLTKSSALFRFSSPEQAESVLDSHLVRTRLDEMGQYKVRVQRARRDLVHTGIKHGVESRKMGRRLIVDGDMPTKQFYIGHAGCILIGNLDPTLTKKALSVIVQPYCATRRDIEGSIEFATCQENLPTGQAYIGFDLPGEAERVIEALGPKFKLGDRPVFIKLIRDRHFPNDKYTGPEKRPERDIDELLQDLNNWEQYVDPEEIKLLEEAGISKHILNEALRAIRYNNSTFGALDYSIRAEALEPQKAAGQQYKELVQLYIQTLKECLVTPEEPGLLYEALHFPDEEIDTEIFEKEHERQEMIKRERARP